MYTFYKEKIKKIKKKDMRNLKDPAIFRKQSGNVYANWDDCYLYSNREQFAEFTGGCCGDVSLFSKHAMYCYYASRHRAERLYYNRRINQNFYSVDYILSGEAYFRTGSRCFIAEADDVVLLHPGCNSEILYPGTTPVESYGFCFQGKLLPELFRVLGLEQTCCLSVRNRNRMLRECCRRLLEAVGEYKTLSGRLAASACLYEFLQCLSMEHSHPPEKAFPGEIRRYLQEHFREDITIRELAARFRMSPPTLKKIFFQHFGQSPFRYLKDLRLEHAAKLLIESNCGIKEIALSSGFFSPQYFCAAFARHYGRTATEYRAEYWEKQGRQIAAESDMDP